MKTKRAFRYRVYPAPEQEAILARTFGCVRYVYNWALDLRRTAYWERRSSLSCGDTSAALTVLKRQPDTAWLGEVSSVPLQQTLRHLNRAFQNFFAGRAAYPRFKTRRGKQSAEFTRSGFQWVDGKLHLAKMGEPLDVRWSRHFSGDPTTVTVSKDPAGRYFVSFLVEEEIAPKPLTLATVGVDLGLKNTVTLSTGEKVGNERFLQRDLGKLARAQQSLSRKQKGSRNRAKARLGVARIMARIADRRRDFLHQLSTRLINENQVICTESLAVKNMMRNHSLARAIGDAGWGELLRQLDYKALWYGRTFVQVDRFYPSSKTCSNPACGHELKRLDLGVRVWTCPECGVTHDRDVNAARNVRAAGLAVFACGEAVRPGRNIRSGKPRRSRKLLRAI
ncbi:MAG: RNA-guided endonuclease InsQ/TnpB family protein [Symbiobacteriia bacterium]